MWIGKNQRAVKLASMYGDMFFAPAKGERQGAFNEGTGVMVRPVRLLSALFYREACDAKDFLRFIGGSHHDHPFPGMNFRFQGFQAPHPVP